MDIESADVEKLQEILKKEKFGTLVAHASYTMNLCWQRLGGR